MIEVPPPGDAEAQWLRQGAMTTRQYVWMKSKAVWIGLPIYIAIIGYEFSVINWWRVLLGCLLIATTSVNVVTALRWRKSHEYWQQWTERWFERQEQWGHLVRGIEE